MEKYLENIYKEEFVRAKARADYEKSLQKTSKPSNSPKITLTKYAIALTQISIAGIGIYALYEIYNLFM